jgi:hypothetical protein
VNNPTENENETAVQQPEKKTKKQKTSPDMHRLLLLCLGGFALAEQA